MAQQRTATLIASERLGEETRLLSFRMADGELGFIGGQYIIVDTGIPIAEKKIAKRAYSILSADHEQGEFQIAVRRIGQGPGSNFMHGLTTGDTLRFSGPWGKFVAVEPAGCDQLVVATDTGITAALGLLRGRSMRSSLEGLRLIWLAESDGYFLPFQFVVGELDRIGARNWSIAETPPVANSARVQQALNIVAQAVAAEVPNRAFLSGDGAVVHAVSDWLTAAGVRGEDVRIECFFNNPQRRIAA
jgi:ferredoxin-NADP reductase